MSNFKYMNKGFDFTHTFKRHTLIVDKNYMICDGNSIREAKFINSTPKGYNFIVNNKGFFLKKHVYPSTGSKELNGSITVYIPRYITVDIKEYENL